MKEASVTQSIAWWPQHKLWPKIQTKPAAAGAPGPSPAATLVATTWDQPDPETNHILPLTQGLPRASFKTINSSK